MNNRSVAIGFAVVALVMALGYEAMASYRSNAFCKSAGEFGDPSYKKSIFKRLAATAADGVTEFTLTHEGAIPGSRYPCSVGVSDGKVVRTRVSHAWTP